MTLARLEEALGLLREGAEHGLARSEIQRFLASLQDNNEDKYPKEFNRLYERERRHEGLGGEKA